MLPRSIFEGFQQKAQECPKKAAIIWKGTTISYEEVYDRVCRLAAFLKIKGVSKNDRVVFFGEKSPRFVYCYLAIHAIEAVAVPLDVKLPEVRFQKIIKHVEPRLILHPIKNEHSIEQYFFSDDLLGLKPIEIQSVPSSKNLADILYTTGTTGFGKAVQLTHKNILAGAINSNTFIENKGSDVEIIPLPLHHAFGLRRLRTNLFLGATVILVDGFMFPKLFFEAIENYGATGICMVPAGFSVIRKLMKDRYISFFKNLRYIEFGSSRMEIEEKRELISNLPNTRICMHYGLTEVAANVFIEFHESRDKLDSLGKASPNVNVTTLDHSGIECRDNEIGEISVKGEIQTPGYWKDDELTKKSFINGWFKTGDLGYKDQDGYFFLTGRNDDVMNIGGKKVLPYEIENLLIQHPTIEDCICVSRTKEGNLTVDEIVAYVKLNNEASVTPKELIKYMSDKIESFKIPKNYIFVDSIPYTNSGKKKRGNFKLD